MTEQRIKNAIDGFHSAIDGNTGGKLRSTQRTMLQKPDGTTAPATDSQSMVESARANTPTETPSPGEVESGT